MRIDAGGRAAGTGGAGSVGKTSSGVKAEAAPRAEARASRDVPGAQALRARVNASVQKAKAACPTTRPVVSVHRGMTEHLSKKDLEKHRDVGNDMASFERAISLGADAIELDVRRTKDGKYVVYHDDRLFHDPGHGKKGRKISDVKLADLPRLSNGEKIPTLDAVIRLSKRTGVQLHVEIKNKAHERAGFLGHHSGKDTALEIAERLQKALPDDRFLLTSFDPATIRAVEDRFPELKTSLWVNKTVMDNRKAEAYVSVVGKDGKKVKKPDPRWVVARAAEKAKADSVSVGGGTASDPALFREARKAGIDVYVGGVQSEASIARFANDPRVAGVITEEPADVLAAQGKKPKTAAKKGPS